MEDFMKAPNAVAFVAIGFIFLCSANVYSIDYKVVEKSEVSFAAKITGGSFSGSTHSIIGYAKYDEKNFTVTSELEIDAASLTTGISLRDKHMREKYLETEKFPKILFSVKDATASNAAKSESELSGTVTIKGTAKEEKIKISVEEGSESQRIVKAKFPINILDFNIKQPKFLVIEMKPVVEVSLRLVLQEEK